ncbi:MAG: hypothetical protein GY711_13955 [bacterium]|nr:hypothetical protein [bacterium]
MLFPVAGRLLPAALALSVVHGQQYDVRVVATSDWPGREEGVNAINDLGVLVGAGLSGEGTYPRAFVDDGTGRRPLGLPANTISSVAAGINDVGDIVGWLGNTTGTYPFVLSAGTTRILPAPGFGFAFHINDAGLIAGVVETTPGLVSTILWKQGQPLVLQTGAQSTRPVDINDAGLVLLEVRNGAATEALVYDSNTGVYTGVDTGATSTQPAAINAAGVVVGGTDGPFGRGFVWTAQGGTRFLPGGTSWAVDINDAGHILASRDLEAGVWVGPTFHPLQAAVDASWPPLFIGRMNATGHILSFAYDPSSGEDWTLLLTPRPEATRYCVAGVNSTGAPALMDASGSASVSLDVLELTAGPVPAGTTGLFFFAANRVQIPFGSGFLCVAAPGRLPFEVADAGVLRHELDLRSGPANAIKSGTTWNFQAWYRDNQASPPWGTSDGVAVTFRP